MVDTNVLIDILTADQGWRSWSATAIEKQSQRGPVVINEIVYAELSDRYSSQQHLDGVVEGLQLQFEWLPKAALYLAGQTFRNYRRAGGPRSSILADFFIGAHAVAAGLPILTRDIRRYRSYFPDVELIAPE
nr:type II toxin-antitoxin system VapC family toxin [Rhodopseudomonas rhenobacensis]